MYSMSSYPYLIRFFSGTFLFLFLSRAAIGQVQYLDTTFRAALSIAERQEKGVLVNLHTDWCGLCQKMDSLVFADSGFGDFVNPRYVSLSLNAEEGLGIDFAMKYRVNTFPQVLFFDPQGHLLFRLTGYLSKESFKSIIAYRNTNQNYLEPLPHPLNFSLDYPEFYRNTYKTRSERSFPTNAQLAAFMASRDSITDEVTWGVLSRLVTNPLYADSVQKYREILIRRYGKLEVRAKLQEFVYAQVKEAIKNKDESELIRALEKVDLYLGERSTQHKIRYQLYFYQMMDDWQKYANLGVQIANDSTLFDTDWLTKIAQTLHRNTDDSTVLKPASEWMKPIAETKPTYATLGTLAWLDYKLGNTDLAQHESEAALAIAIEEKVKDTTEVEALQKILKIAK